jgi:hypothetical protein
MGTTNKRKFQKHKVNNCWQLVTIKDLDLAVTILGLLDYGMLPDEVHGFVKEFLGFKVSMSDIKELERRRQMGVLEYI